MGTSARITRPVARFTHCAIADFRDDLQIFAQRAWVYAKSALLAVHEVRNRPAVADRIGGGDESQCRNKYFIA